MIYEDLICGFEQFHVLILPYIIYSPFIIFSEELFNLFLSLMTVLCSVI